MLNKQHIATLAAASVAWGLFAMTVGTSDLDHDKAVPGELAAEVTLTPKARPGLPHTLSTIAPAPLGPLAFDDEGVDAQSSNDVGPSVAGAEPGRNRQLVTGLMLESAGLQKADEAALSAGGTDLSLRVGSLPTLAIGESGDLTLVLSNHGPGVATTELIAYDLPYGVDLATAGPNGCTVEDRQVLCWVTETLDPGHEAVVTIPVVLLETEDDHGPISDGWAGIVVSETADPNSGNDSVSVAPHRAPQPAAHQTADKQAADKQAAD